MNQRRWITREEIAEIYDSAAEREVNAAIDLVEIDTEESLVQCDVHLTRYHELAERARQVRATEEAKPLVREGGYLIRSGRSNW